MLPISKFGKYCKYSHYSLSKRHVRTIGILVSDALDDMRVLSCRRGNTSGVSTEFFDAQYEPLVIALIAS